MSHRHRHRSSNGGISILGGSGSGRVGNSASYRHHYRSADLTLFVRDVRDGGELRKKRAISVRSWSTIKDVKDIIQRELHIPANSQRLYFGPLLTSGGELPNHRTLQDAGIERSGETLWLDLKSHYCSSQQLQHARLVPSSSLDVLSPSPTVHDVCISSAMLDATPRALKGIVQAARRGFARGYRPELVLDGTGGTYFLHDVRKRKIAVFKPADEEPYAPNNPRGYLRQPGTSRGSGNTPMSLREGVDPGQACIREVAAYLLDHQGLSGVPMTTLAEARHFAFNTNGKNLKVAEGGASMGVHSTSMGALTASASPTLNLYDPVQKAGSLQEFVQGLECTMDDISPSKISVEEVHKIAILDIRILNADRNSANLLVRHRLWDNNNELNNSKHSHHHEDSYSSFQSSSSSSGQVVVEDLYELVPIDHGYCLRSVADVSWMDWCWLDWPQLKKPLSEQHRSYILNLDIEADALMLSDRFNICQEAIDYFRASSSLLKAGVKAGLSLYEIACMCCRNDNQAEIPSVLEKLVDMADELASTAMENDRWDHTAASRALVKQLTPHRRQLGNQYNSCSVLPLTSSLSSKSDDESDPSLAVAEKQLLELMGVRSPHGSSASPFSSTNEDISVLLLKTKKSPSALTLALEGGSRGEEGRDSPVLLAQSSASDSSSDVEAGDGDTFVDNEELGLSLNENDLCEEWAAAVIFDVGGGDANVLQPLNHLAALQHHLRRNRSCSMVSDDGSESGLSSSPKGFWHVQPGLLPLTSSSSMSITDDASVTWSPCASPMQTPRSLLLSPDDHVNSLYTLSPLLPLDDTHLDYENSNNSDIHHLSSRFIPPASSSSKQSTVTFACNLAPGPYLLPKSAIKIEDTASKIPPEETFHPLTSDALMPTLNRSESSSLSRSKSYSALSIASMEKKKKLKNRSSYQRQKQYFTAGKLTNTSRHPDHGYDCVEKYDIYRNYFHNFIDLVIVRETTAAARAAQNKLSQQQEQQPIQQQRQEQQQQTLLCSV